MNLEQTVERYSRFSLWKTLVRVIMNIRTLPRKKSKTAETISEVENFIIRKIQHMTFQEDFTSQPIIIPKGHQITVLLTRYFHASKHLLGSHLTEGAIRSAGYWIVGGKDSFPLSQEIV